DRLPPVRRGRWVAIGRLDYNSCGLMVFTNSGELANRMMHPRYGLEREYAVRVTGDIGPVALEALRGGVDLADGPARFTNLEAAGGTGSNKWYHVTLGEDAIGRSDA